MIECRIFFNSSRQYETTASWIYIADFTRRSNNQRGVEVHETAPFDPSHPDEFMDALILENQHHLPLRLGILPDDRHHCNSALPPVEHPEGWFCPKSVSKNSFIAFIEIKDCEVKKMSSYKKEILDKYESIYESMKGKISKGQRFYYIVSFPRRRKPYSNFYTENDPTFRTEMLKKYRVILYCSNHIQVKNAEILTLGAYVEHGETR